MSNLIINILLIIMGVAIAAGQTCPGANTYWKVCGSSCKDYCTKDPSISCITLCTPGCNCIPGYKFKGADANFCVPAILCPTCPPNQEYKVCGSACSEYCGKPPGSCIEVCTERCFCRSGYIFENEDRLVCIPKDDCP